MKKQILWVSGELSTFKLQLINSFAFQEAKTNERINSFLYPQNSACCSYSHASYDHHCCSVPAQKLAVAVPTSSQAAQDPCRLGQPCTNSPFPGSSQLMVLLQPYRNFLYFQPVPGLQNQLQY